MISYEPGTVPVPHMPRAIAELYVWRYLQWGPSLQARWLRQHEERGLGFDFTFEVFESAEPTLKDYFIDNQGNVSPDWDIMISGGTVDATRLDFVYPQGVFNQGISGTDLAQAVLNAWPAEPKKWPLTALDFPQSGTQVFFVWVVWHMHWLFVAEMLRSITEYKWRIHPDED